MKLWDDIRNYFYTRNLERRLGVLNISRTLLNLNDTKSIGVLFDCTSAANDAAVAAFAENLKEKGKTVEILGYTTDRKTDAKPGLWTFGNKNVNWARVPWGEAVEKFAGTRFDLLITGFTGENLPLQYISRISQAKCRVGEYSEKKTDCYELMVNTNGNNSLQYFFEQSIYYLNQIKNDSK